MSLLTPGPIMIPLPASRSPSPLPPQPDMEGTPPMSMSRERSGTMSSAASSSSFPHIQTPPTPSVLAIGTRGGSIDVGRPRKLSYGFGQVLFMSPVEVDWEDRDHLTTAVEQSTPVLAQPSEPTRSADSYFTLGAPITSGIHSQVLPELTIPSYPSTPTELDESDQVVELPSGSIISPPKDKSIRATVRRKLERAKSSFKSRRDDDEIGGEPRRSRLRSLFSSSSRSQSTLSIRSLASNASIRPPTPVSLGHQPVTTIFDPPMRSAQIASNASNRPPTPVSSVPEPIIAISDIPARPSLIVAADYDERSTGVGEGEKGKRRASSPQLRTRKRPALLTAVTVSPAPPSPTSINAYNELVHANSAPVLGEESLAGVQDEPKACLFDEILPNELKIRVFKFLLDLHEDDEGNQRWVGKHAGPRELIRLSRVSKHWQSLCLDGQLWSLSDLGPFANELHHDTLRRILVSTSSYIKTLSLRGMDNIEGSELVHNLAGLRPESLSLPNLTHLDLRGCKGIAAYELCAIVTAAPKLTIVNFRGVKAVTSLVMRAVGRLNHLESLDVSRCSNMSLTDIGLHLETISDDQAARLRILKMGAIRGYGLYAEQVLPFIAKRLINLHTLDMNGCHHWQMEEKQAFTSAIAATGLPSPIRHLVLSGCQFGTQEIAWMIGHFPHLTILEMATMTDWHRGFDEPSDPVIARFLKSCPLLQKIDLEGMFAPLGEMTIEALIPTKKIPGPVLGRSLIELQVGGAKSISPETFIRLIRSCPKLTVLGCNNTRANSAVMRDFLRRRSAPASINMVDCRNIDSAEYNSIAHSTRPREGWQGYNATPFGYGEGDLAHQVVVKTYWSWRRVGVPKGWRESLADADKDPSGIAVGSGRSTSARRAVMRRGASWWRILPEEEELSSGSCTIM
ncbi:hypothetical protein BCR39DRAFT_176746 [Naematelia encephala]|uniref:F-box domain-containing protein n=1 Tax=Naematelia encephala TaxID=71784 RepID=A0A1Y2B3H5_9TREE|nr:hypothetical protein BCR39DRAFT_176746 [Naematelia encephala]